MLMNFTSVVRMCFNKQCIKLFLKANRIFSKDKEYKLTNLIKASLHVIKNDRIKVHDRSFIVNSFLPPLSSKAYESVFTGVPGQERDMFSNHIRGRRKSPISVYIECTSRCMYKCWHCSAAKRSQSEDIPTAGMQKLVKDLQDMGVGIIGFTGGEPLLREDIEEILNHIDGRSVSFIFSTGYGLTLEKAKQLKAAGLLGIAISIDSANAGQHDVKRGFEGAFKIAVEAIRNAKKAGLYTMSQTVCTKELLRDDNLLKLAMYLKALDIDEMRIVEPLPCGRLDSHEDQLLDLDEKNKLKDFHIRCNRDSKLPKASVFAYFESEDQFGCGAGVQHSYIDSTGNLYPCDFVPMSFGNIFDTPVSELWKEMHESMGIPHCYCFSKAHMEEIRRHSGGVYPVPKNVSVDICSRCKSSELPGFYRILAGEKYEG